MDRPLISNREWGKNGPTAVILGARLHSDGTASTALLRRVSFGCALYHQGKVCQLLMSGGPTTPPWTEAEQMAHHAHALGVPKEHLMRESAAMNTRDNARLSCSLLLEFPQSRDVIVITDLYHLPRAWLTFRIIGRRSGFQFRFSPCPPPPGSYHRPRYWLAALREIPAIAADLIRSWRIPPPCP